MSSQPSALGPRDPRLDAWRTFLYAHAHVRRLLERELQAEQGMGMGEYEVLLLLAYSPERRQRMRHRSPRAVGAADGGRLRPAADRLSDAPARHRGALREPDPAG